jgi:hypothetical protein
MYNFQKLVQQLSVGFSRSRKLTIAMSIVAVAIELRSLRTDRAKDAANVCTKQPSPGRDADAQTGDP